MQLRRPIRCGRWTLLTTGFALPAPYSGSAKLDPDVRTNIGRNTERITTDTAEFFRQRRPRVELDPRVELLIQNGPEDVLLHTHGPTLYHRGYRIMSLGLWIWWGLRYRALTVHATPLPNLDDPLVLRLRWRIDGTRRSLFATHEPTVLVTGYSHCGFDERSGALRRHVIDRIVPPARGWLWWYLERRLWTSGSLPAKPLVGSVDKPE